MGNKKLLIGFISSLFLLCSCGEITVPPIMGNGGDTGNKSPEETIEKSEPVDTYLVLSSIGLYNGSKGRNIEDKMLENAVVYTAKPGENLPTKDEISAVSGSNGVFEGWVCYEGTGFPTVYTTVPSVNGIILYATFKNSDGTPTESPSNPISPETYTAIYLDATVKLNESDELTWASGDAAITMYVWSFTTGDYQWIKMTNNGTGIYYANVNIDKYTNVIFVRHSNNELPTFEDGGYWNKTGSLLFIADKNCFKITSWNNGGIWTNK